MMRRILVILLSLFAVQFASLFSENNLGSESIIILISPRSPAPGLPEVEDAKTRLKNILGQSQIFPK